MARLDGVLGDRRKLLEHEWMRARQPMYEPGGRPHDCPRCEGCVVQPGRRLNPVHEHVMCEHEAAFVERILAR